MTLVGVAQDDVSDAVVLRMLAHVLEPDGCRLEVINHSSSALKLTEAVSELEPDLVIVSHLPPTVLTPTRYLVKRLRARRLGQPIVVGHWGSVDEANRANEQLKAAGATRVVSTIADARERILECLLPAKSAVTDSIPHPH